MVETYNTCLLYMVTHCCLAVSGEMLIWELGSAPDPQTSFHHSTRAFMTCVLWALCLQGVFSGLQASEAKSIGLAEDAKSHLSGAADLLRDAY